MRLSKKLRVLPNKKYLLLLLPSLIVIIFFSISFFLKKDINPQDFINFTINKNDRYKLFATSSPYTVIEYLDLNCIYCKNLNTLENSHESELDNINLILRNHPLLESGRSAFKALIGECIAKQSGAEKWIHYIDLSFKDFDKKYEDSYFKALGASLVDNKNSFDGCLSDESLMKKVQDDRNTNIISQVTSVPFMVVLKGDKVVNVYEGVGGKLGLEILKYYNSLTSE